jgi:acetylornithine deacetylase
MGMDTLILGPGSINQAHQPDEFLPCGSITPCVDLLEGFIAQFCGPADAAGGTSRAGHSGS